MNLQFWARNAFRGLRAYRSKYQRQVQVHVHRSALESNLQTFQRACHDACIAPVLKSNAYGHGLIQVAQILDSAACPFFVVDGYHEALILRNEGIATPLLVMGFTPTDNILRSRLREVAFMVGDLDQLSRLAANGRTKCRLHLKINTGLQRYGIAPQELDQALNLIDQISEMQLEGICSHFADAANPDPAYTEMQLTQWNQLTDPLQSRVRYLHLVNTAGTARIQKAVGNVARVGLGLYGYDTHPVRKLSLQPALSIYSRLGAVRRIHPGESVGYGLTWRASAPTTIALVPTGYNACVDARLSNKGAFRMGDDLCPIVGRVCMNTTMIDVSQVAEVNPDQVVEVISSQSGAANSIGEIARLCDTTSHIILTGISPHLQRIITQ